MCAHVVLRELVALVSVNRNAPLRHLAPLAFRLYCAGRCEAAEVVVEGIEIMILPLELNSRAWKENQLVRGASRSSARQKIYVNR